jgi:IS5 family transposase
LLTSEEEQVFGDSGYQGAEKREKAITRNNKNQKIKYNINRCPSSYKGNSARSIGQIKRREKAKSSVRSKVEHVFGVVKGLFGFKKTRYKGLAKQTAKANIMFALANLYLAGKRYDFQAC